MRAIKSLPLLFLMISIHTAAQNVMTSSPYSMFGLGEISTGLGGQQAAMGGVGYGMRDGLLMNNLNPAGLTALDSCALVAEASAFLRAEDYHSGGSSNQAIVGNFSAFSIGARLIPRWYASVGVTPYSVVGYYFNTEETLEGSPGTIYTSTYTGSGGLSKAYLTQSFRLSHSLSAGVNLSYIFGNMTEKETQSTMSIARAMDARQFYADFGLQYSHRLKRDLAFVLGAVYGYRQKLTLDNTLTVTGSSTEDVYEKKKITQYLPQFFGLGASLEYKKCTYALDYTFREYSLMQSDDSRVRFKDAHELRMGFCYFPNGYAAGSYWNRISYKAGLVMSTPYLSINNRSGLSLRGTLGFGFPILNGRLNVSGFYERFHLEGNALQRNTAGLTITYTISELMHKVKL